MLILIMFVSYPNLVSWRIEIFLYLLLLVYYYNSSFIIEVVVHCFEVKILENDFIIFVQNFAGTLNCTYFPWFLSYFFPYFVHIQVTDTKSVEVHMGSPMMGSLK